MLATDLDGTFIGDDAAMSTLWRDLEAEGIVIVFATGRHLASIERFYEDEGTARRAAACICMVGTEIWHFDDGAYARDATWAATISETWDKPAIEASLASVPGLVLQPDEWQSEFKSSYFLDEGARVVQIRETLAQRGLPAKIVYSADRFLDLLPHRSGKGEAVAYLADHHGVTAADVITAGDSGNDFDMMQPQFGFRCVVVGNATEELSSYQAAHVYHARRHHAAGIREGLVTYGWLTE